MLTTATTTIVIVATVTAVTSVITAIISIICKLRQMVLVVVRHGMVRIATNTVPIATPCAATGSARRCDMRRWRLKGCRWWRMMVVLV